jgi:hypothetical protein
MKSLFALFASAALAPLASAQLMGGPAPALILHGGTYGSGASLPTDAAIADLSALRFNDQVSSVTVNAGAWELCEQGNYGGRCEIVDASVADLSLFGLNDNISSVRPAGARTALPGTAPPADAALVLYSEDGRRGQSVGLNETQRDFNRLRFNDRARSIEVRQGVWKLCEHTNLGGRCEYVDSSTRSLADLGLTGQISSAERTSYERAPHNYSIALFADENMRGAFVGLDEGISDLSARNFNDRASSILVTRGRWLVCEHQDFRGLCEIVDQPLFDLNVLALNDRITSVRRYDESRDHDWRDNDWRRDPGDWRGGDDRYGRGGGYDDGVPGEETVFFARPTERGQRIRNGDGAATRFCRGRGFSEAVYKGQGRFLSDVLCR